jgi:hypothetical protein
MGKRRANRQDSSQARGIELDGESVSKSASNGTVHGDSVTVHHSLGGGPSPRSVIASPNFEQHVMNGQLSPAMSGCDGAGDDNDAVKDMASTISTAVNSAMKGAVRQQQQQLQTLNDTMTRMVQAMESRSRPAAPEKHRRGRSDTTIQRRRKDNKQRRRQPPQETDSSSSSSSSSESSAVSAAASSSEEDSDGGEGSSSTIRSPVRRSQRRPGNAKLPVFTGKEAWKVWYNRFNEVAERRRWSSDDKLDELLPLLQGAVGEVVYGQLSHHTRSKYQLLTAELASRYRVVETTRTFAAQFSRRNQGFSETVEEYAADLKHLYDKAFKERNNKTRRQDLLRKFLDGLHNEKARFMVEYVKEPATLDDAVLLVVDFTETQRRPNHAESGFNSKTRRPMRHVYDSDEGEQYVENSFSEVGRACKDKAKSPPRITITEKPGSNAGETTPTGNGDHLLQTLVQRLDKMDAILAASAMGNNNSRPFNSAQRTPATGPQSHQREVTCYSCQLKGHYSRECPTRDVIARRQGNDRGNRPNYPAVRQDWQRPTSAYQQHRPTVNMTAPSRFAHSGN